jgi:hypothetical protein
MMTSSKNLSKHLKNCYRTKTNKEMAQHYFQIFGIKKKMIKYFLFIFMHNFKLKNLNFFLKTHHDMWGILVRNKEVLGLALLL